MKNILIVDNSPDLLDLFSLFFQKENFSVKCCNGRASFFENLQTLIPDLMIIDVAGSGIDNKTISGDLKKRTALKSIPIIITSTYSTHVKNYKSFGADDGIEKPFDIKELLYKVKNLLNKEKIT